DKQDPLSRWIRNLMERRGYWRAAVAIAAKNARMAWAVLHYGDTFMHRNFKMPMHQADAMTEASCLQSDG
ncbi:hypothetical protein QCD83_28065, partial [Pseudomonas savastanoi pv. phaseolicola]|nr:hypothetical protein [Pseudomonas savastanoi pv. phaseolicola]MDG6392939.1 hypothetical protein [Pseudomonas savastanoi pv. phaseolicola]